MPDVASIISVSELNNLQKMNNEKLVVLYTTMQGAPATKPPIVLDNPQQFIPDSIFFDFQYDIADKDSHLSNTMPSHPHFQDAVRQLGINQDSEIVVYDDFGNFCASRVWFMFKTCGHDRIRVVDGGLPAWLRADFETTKTCRTENGLGDFVASENPNFRFVDRQFVYANMQSKELPLLDARSLQRFEGRVPETKVGLRSGHIPNALNLHYSLLLNDMGEFIEEAGISQAFSKLNMENGVLFSCGSGVTACILAQAADMLNQGPLFVYDGSWSDWGADHSLPMELVS